MDMALADLGHSLVVVLLTLAVVLFPMNLFGFRSGLERDLKITAEFSFEPTRATKTNKTFI